MDLPKRSFQQGFYEVKRFSTPLFYHTRKCVKVTERHQIKVVAYDSVALQHGNHIELVESNVGFAEWSLKEQVEPSHDDQIVLDFRFKASVNHCAQFGVAASRPVRRLVGYEPMSFRVVVTYQLGAVRFAEFIACKVDVDCVPQLFEIRKDVFAVVIDGFGVINSD